MTGNNFVQQVLPALQMLTEYVRKKKRDLALQQVSSNLLPKVSQSSTSEELLKNTQEAVTTILTHPDLEVNDKNSLMNFVSITSKFKEAEIKANQELQLTGLMSRDFEKRLLGKRLVDSMGNVVSGDDIYGEIKSILDDDNVPTEMKTAIINNRLKEYSPITVNFTPVFSGKDNKLSGIQVSYIGFGNKPFLTRVYEHNAKNKVFNTKGNIVAFKDPITGQEHTFDISDDKLANTAKELNIQAMRKSLQGMQRLTAMLPSGAYIDVDGEKVDISGAANIFTDDQGNVYYAYGKGDKVGKYKVYLEGNALGISQLVESKQTSKEPEFYYSPTDLTFLSDLGNIIEKEDQEVKLFAGELIGSAIQNGLNNAMLEKKFNGMDSETKKAYSEKLMKYLGQLAKEKYSKDDKVLAVIDDLMKVLEKIKSNQPKSKNQPLTFSVPDELFRE